MFMMNARPINVSRVCVCALESDAGRPRCSRSKSHQRQGRIAARARNGRMMTTKVMAVNVDQVQKSRSMIREIIRETHANPIFVRLAWHDSGSYVAFAR